MLNGLVIWGLGAGLSQFIRPRPLFTWNEKAGRGLFLLALAPIIALAVLRLLGRGLIAAFREYRWNGKWPGSEPLLERLRPRRSKPPE